MPSHFGSTPLTFKAYLCLGTHELPLDWQIEVGNEGTAMGGHEGGALAFWGIRAPLYDRWDRL